MRSPRDRILDGVVKLVCEVGRKNITQPKLASAARMSITTLRKQFPPEAGDVVHSAIHATLVRELRQIDETVPTPTGDLRKDLVDLVTGYRLYYENEQFLMYLFGDLTRDQEFQGTFKRLQSGTITKLAFLYAFYERRNAWAPPIQGLEGERLNSALTIPLLGTVFVSVYWGRAGIGPTDEFDAELLVDRFLLGYGNPTDLVIGRLEELVAELKAARASDQQPE